MRRQLSFVIAPAFEPFDVSGPMCALNFANDFYGARYETNIVAAASGPVKGWTGMSLHADQPASAAHGDTVVVVGGPEASIADRQPATVALLRELAPRTKRLVSVCTGAFYLAEAGVLDGRRVTTHWRYASLLRSRFPGVVVETDRIYLCDKDVWTSAGVMAGIDLALALIESDFGVEVAKGVARELVVYHRRAGGQTQFSAILQLAPSSDRVQAALTFAREHLREPLPVERLASAARLSSRQFARLFSQETGETPARAVERLRAEVARARVEESREPIELIAEEVGFGSAETMRRAFVRLYSQTPQTLRRHARGEDRPFRRDTQAP